MLSEISASLQYNAGETVMLTALKNYIKNLSVMCFSRNSGVALDNSQECKPFSLKQEIINMKNVSK